VKPVSDLIHTIVEILRQRQVQTSQGTAMQTVSARILVAISAFVCAASAAHAESFRVDYSVSLYGLNIAQSSFKSRIEGDSFQINGQLSSAGIAKMFDSTKGTASVSGGFGPDTASADRYLVNYTSGKKKKKTEVAFSNGRVTSTENVPPPRLNRKNWVDVKQDDLASVTDPLSATMVRASGLDDVCAKTMKIYDGELRADLRLSFIKKESVDVTGYSGPAVTCSARFIPLGGYRGSNKSIAFLKNQSKILITFAPLGGTGVYAPVKASATTEIGTVVVTAGRFETVQ
jgi:hypothetical protein